MALRGAARQAMGPAFGGRNAAVFSDRSSVTGIRGLSLPAARSRRCKIRLYAAEDDEKGLSENRFPPRRRLFPVGGQFTAFELEKADCSGALADCDGAAIG